MEVKDVSFVPRETQTQQLVRGSQEIRNQARLMRALALAKRLRVAKTRELIKKAQGCGHVPVV